MRLLFAVCFSTTLLFLIARHGADSGTAVQPIVPKMPDLSGMFKNMPAPRPIAQGKLSPADLHQPFSLASSLFF